MRIESWTTPIGFAFVLKENEIVLTVCLAFKELIGFWFSIWEDLDGLNFELEIKGVNFWEKDRNKRR